MELRDKKAFARRLLERMDEMPINQSELAMVLGTNQSSVYNWLQGTIPRGDRLEDLADALGVTARWLLKGIEPKFARDGEKIETAKITEIIETVPPDKRKLILRLAKKFAA